MQDTLKIVLKFLKKFMYSSFQILAYNSLNMILCKTDSLICVLLPIDVIIKIDYINTDHFRTFIVEEKIAINISCNFL